MKMIEASDLFTTDAVVDNDAAANRYSRKPDGTSDQGRRGED